MVMVEPIECEPERLVKSEDRVRDLAEVFTPSRTVQDMLNLIPAEMWQIHPSPTFFEPACGDGNFLEPILDRKLQVVAAHHAAGTLPAGTTAEAAQFHALEALASIYAVDISVDNIVGGTPGHEIGARTRLLTMFLEWNHRMLGKKLNARSNLLRAAHWIIERNVIVGNMLSTSAAAMPTDRDEMSLLDYEWHPATLCVTVKETSMGSVLAGCQAETTGVMSLFGTPEPTLLWSGAAVEIHRAPRLVAAPVVGTVRNGKERGKQR